MEHLDKDEDTDETVSERDAYVVPELIEYGTVARLTASGSGMMSEMRGSRGMMRRS